MMSSKFLKSVGLAIALCFASVSSTAMAQTTAALQPSPPSPPRKSLPRAISSSATPAAASVRRLAPQSQGEPTAYCRRGRFAVIGGLRFGEGTIYYKDGITQKIYWQGPSVGFDFGGNGSRTMVLVYNSDSPRELYKRFIGVEGSAYLVGGIGVNLQKYRNITLAPIRTGVGARFGANVGYLKYSKNPTWNPF
jgi:hypothetical protein